MLHKLPKNRSAWLLGFVAIGAMMMLLARFFAPDTQEEIFLPVAYLPAAVAEAANDKEARLEEFFSLVQGAGDVRVMLGFSGERETIFAVDTTANESTTREEDGQGGTREVQSNNQSQQTVILSGAGGARPLVIREAIPTIEGVIIIAQGGADPQVRADLTRAAQAVLGLDAHRIQVLAKRIN